MLVLEPDHGPVTEAVGGGLSRVMRPIAYKWIDKLIYKVVVPEGFLFDGASIPRLFWTLLGLTPHGDMDGPALIHDFIYHYQGQLPAGSVFCRQGGEWVPLTEPIPKSMADNLLETLCVRMGVVGSVRSWLVWAAVAAFGGFAWRRDDEERKFAKIDTLAVQL